MSEERMAYRPNEAARVSGVSRDVIFKAIREGKLRSLKCGASRLITAEALKQWLEELERETGEQ